MLLEARFGEGVAREISLRKPLIIEATGPAVKGNVIFSSNVS
jgi:hypothetical protein